MNHCYTDILKLTKKKPLWFDEHAVPRYCRFEPHQVANIYARACALVLINCQNCGTQFKVAFSWSGYDGSTPEMERLLNAYRPPKTVREVEQIHYGDPPNVRCCASGPTMNCNDLRVLEWWTCAHGAADWERVPKFEVLLADHADFEERKPTRARRRRAP